MAHCSRRFVESRAVAVERGSFGGKGEGGEVCPDNDRDKSARVQTRCCSEINNNGQEPLVKLINYASHYVHCESSRG